MTRLVWWMIKSGPVFCSLALKEKVVFLILPASWFYDIANLMLHAYIFCHIPRWNIQIVSWAYSTKSLVLHCRWLQGKLCSESHFEIKYLVTTHIGVTYMTKRPWHAAFLLQIQCIFFQNIISKVLVRYTMRGNVYKKHKNLSYLCASSFFKKNIKNINGFFGVKPSSKSQALL